MEINLDEFFRKLIFARQLKIHDGYMEIYGLPYVFFPAESFSVLMDSMIKLAGKEGKIKIYEAGKYVGKEIAKNLERSISTKGDDLLDVIFHIGGMGGWGLWRLYKNDKAKKEGIVRGWNIATAQCLYQMKKRSEPSCHILRGIIAGELRESWRDESIEVIETQCISQGFKFCEFIAKRSADFDKKNKFVKNQLNL
jgi:predicted hydrocarbon binding protein